MKEQAKVEVVPCESCNMLGITGRFIVPEPCQHRNSQGHELASWCSDCGKQLSGLAASPSPASRDAVIDILFRERKLHSTDCECLGERECQWDSVLARLESELANLNTPAAAQPESQGLVTQLKELIETAKKEHEKLMEVSKQKDYPLASGCFSQAKGVMWLGEKLEEILAAHTGDAK